MNENSNKEFFKLEWENDSLGGYSCIKAEQDGVGATVTWRDYPTWGWFVVVTGADGYRMVDDVRCETIQWACELARIKVADILGIKTDPLFDPEVPCAEIAEDSRRLVVGMRFMMGQGAAKKLAPVFERDMFAPTTNPYAGRLVPSTFSVDSLLYLPKKAVETLTNLEVL